MIVKLPKAIRESKSLNLILTHKFCQNRKIRVRKNKTQPIVIRKKVDKKIRSPKKKSSISKKLIELLKNKSDKTIFTRIVKLKRRDFKKYSIEERYNEMKRRVKHLRIKRGSILKKNSTKEKTMQSKKSKNH